MVDTGRAPNTIRRAIGRARQFFKAAMKRGLIQRNPFEDLPAAVKANLERFHYVSREDTQKILDQCPDAEWKLIVALSRYGGLRCPSEVLSLKWSDINWEHGRVRVPSPKTAHHEGGASRMIPLFPELRQPLLDVFEQAIEGVDWVITRYRDAKGCNLRTQFNRIVVAAGLETWTKPFQNMRSTRETELAEEYPLHVVCAWIGNSQPVAAKHYLQVTSEHFRRASVGGAQNGALEVQNVAETTSTEQEPPETESATTCCDCSTLRLDTAQFPSLPLTRISRRATGLELPLPRAILPHHPA